MTYRNVFCPSYRRCLDKAIRTHAQDFDCRGCPRGNEEEPFTDEPFGYIALWTAILCPDLWRTYQKDKLLERFREAMDEEDPSLDDV